MAIKNILVTGGAGYLGSHICVSLLELGYMPIIVDDLSNAHSETIDRISKIAGKKPIFYKIDVCDEPALRAVFDQHDIHAVMHLAAKKAVEESVQKPLAYYDTNLNGLLTCLRLMSTYAVKCFVYSSSATVYAPISLSGLYAEHDTLGPLNPYGWTKFMGEQIIRDVVKSNGLIAGVLRYFNPVGAHPSGLIGEYPLGKPNNLMPLLAQVVTGERDNLTIFGADYDTPDGTAIRDYVHVMDVAEAHVASLDLLLSSGEGFTFNIGTGQGQSVKDIIDTYSRVNNVKIPYVFGKRRVGDAGHICANTQAANDILGWHAKRNIDDMCRDLHRWVINLKSLAR